MYFLKATRKKLRMGLIEQHQIRAQCFGEAYRLLLSLFSSSSNSSSRSSSSFSHGLGAHFQGTVQTEPIYDPCPNVK